MTRGSLADRYVWREDAEWRKKQERARRRYAGKGFVLTYRERDELLVELGFSSYAEYLRSDTWKKVRRRVLDRDKWRCQFCGKPKCGIVHHIQYTPSNLTGRKLHHMVTTCDQCHRKVEFGKRGGKRSLFDAARVGESMRSKGKAKVRKAVAKERQKAREDEQAIDYVTLIFGRLK